MYNSNVLVGAKNEVLKKTFFYLALSMIPTVIAAMIGLHYNFAVVMAEHTILTILGFLGLSIGLSVFISSTQNQALGVLGLFTFAFIWGLFLTGSLSVALSGDNGGQVVALAAGGTGLILVAMSILATTIKRDLSKFGQFLFIGLLLVIVASIVNMFFAIPAASLALSTLCILIFSGYIVYDVNKVVTGGETNPVRAALQIYMDVINIFISLLNILGRK